MKKLLLLCLLLSYAGLSMAQSRITGHVHDNQGTPLVGVSVTLLDTKLGALTDSRGNFSLDLGKSGISGPRLQFSYAGYTPVILMPKPGQLMDITLQENDSYLDDIVVVGYGTVKRKDLTGSVSSITAKDIADIPLNSAAEVLEGRLAGVHVASTEGKPGAEVTVKVRGGGSITQDNSPIYIVDGVQVEDALSFLSPQEIASVDVLKDAASTAIYGARGANGVVVITTKTGKNAKTRIALNIFDGRREITSKIKVLNPADFVNYEYQIYNRNTDEQTQNAFRDRYGRFEDLDIYGSFPQEDWQEDVFGRSANTFTQNMNVTGGDAKSDFSISLSNTDEQGIMLNSGFRRSLASFKFNHKFSKKVKFGVSARYGQQRVEGAGTSNTGTQSSNQLRNSIRYQPYIGGAVPSDLDIFDPDYANETNLVPPVLNARQEIQYRYRKDFLVNGYLDINFLRHFQFRSVVGATPSTNLENRFYGLYSSTARQNANMPAAYISRGESVSITNSNTISFNKDFKEHSLNLLIGEETYQTKGNSLSTLTKWLPTSITADEAFAGIQRAVPPDGAIQDAPNATESAPTRMLSFFGRANYSYKDKYIASASVRRDGSNRFSPENRWGSFPAFAFAWRMSKESFWAKLDPKQNTDMKIRLSYGMVGNNRIGGDLYHTVYNTSKASYAYGASVTPGMQPASLANPNVKWETTISRNLGLDLSLFRGKLNATVDIYNNTTKNLLLDAQVPSTLGYQTQIQNIGKTSNKGIELTLGGDLIDTKNFHWTSSFNLAHNKNKVIDLGYSPDGSKVDFLTFSSGWITSSTMDFLVQVGQPVGQFYGFVNDGYYTIEDFDYDNGKYTLKDGIANNRTALGNRDPQPGDMKFKKTSSDSSMIITDADKQVIGNAQPKLTGGWNNQFVFKNFDMSVFIYFSLGGDVYNANKIEYTTQYLYKDNNMLNLVKNRWKWYDDQGQLVTEPDALAVLNKNTSFWTPAGGQFTPQSFAIEDGSFVRISNVTLGYTLPNELVRRTRVISGLRFYATVNNLYTFTNYTGFDPEANTRRKVPMTPGVDYAAYPRSRFIVLGANINF